MRHLPINLAIVLILFIFALHASNSIEESECDSIERLRFVNTNMQIKTFNNSLIIPPIPPLAPGPSVLEDIINNSRYNKSEFRYTYTMLKRKKDELMDKFRRKPDLPAYQCTKLTLETSTTTERSITSPSIDMPPIIYPQIITTSLRPATTTLILGTSTTTQRSITSPSIEIPPIIYPQITTTSLRPATTTLILGTLTTTQRSITSPSIEIPPIIYPPITTTTLRPIITTQLAATTSTLYPLTTTERDLALGSDSDGFGKLIVGLLTAGTLVLFVYYLLWQITFTVPFILFVPKFPVGGPPPRLPGTLKPPTNRTPKPSDNDDGDNSDKSDDSDEEDEDCEKSKDKKSKDECEKKKKKRNPCKINIKKISDDYPLIIQHTDHSKFLYPQSKGKIVLQPDDKITFGCNSADTYSCKNITIIENVVSHAESTISSMSCSLSAAKIHSKIQFLQGYFGKKSQYQKFQIGLSYGRNFVPTITGYYNAALESTAFVRSTLSSAIGYKQKKPPQRELQQDLLAWSPDVYSLSSQQDTFSQLLLCHGNSTHKGDCSYVNRDSYLEPALLTPASHFVYTRAAATAHYYMNSAPMWNTIKYGNWDKIEKHVQRMASSLKKDLIVITGVYGQLRLPDFGGLYKDIFMETDYDECSKSIVVPQYFWKLVYDPVSVNGKPSGIVYVTVNNPFMDSKNYYKICQKPGQSVNGESPAGWKPNSFKSGFSYVCAVDDFILTTRLDLVDRLS